MILFIVILAGLSSCFKCWTFITFLVFKFRLLAPYFFGNSAKEVSKKTPPRHPSFYFALKDKSPQNKSPFFSPDFCGAAELTNQKAWFAQTVLAKSPTKITPSSAWLMGNKVKVKSVEEKSKDKIKNPDLSGSHELLTLILMFIPLSLAENCIPVGAKSQGCDFEGG